MLPIVLTYWIWIPLEIMFYGMIAFFSKKNNEANNAKFFFIVMALNFIPLWAFIAMDSVDPAFDGLLYNVIMVLAPTATLLILGCGNKFNQSNWLGLFLILIGFICINL